MAKKLDYPTAITLDLANKLVYWSDIYMDTVECVNYNGKNRRVIVRGAKSIDIYSLEAFQNDIYVASWADRSIKKLNRYF